MLTKYLTINGMLLLFEWKQNTNYSDIKQIKIKCRGNGISSLPIFKYDFFSFKILHLHLLHVQKSFCMYFLPMQFLGPALKGM